MSAAAPRPASTVVLVRPADSGFEVLLVRRHDNVAFMGGAHVFPGGRVDDPDRIAHPERVCDGLPEAISRLPDLSPGDAVGHYVAAIRELLEEAGVLLARPVAAVDVVELRTRILERVSLADLCYRYRFRLALDALIPFAHWVTPAIETRRFDTRFFVAMLPAAQSALHDDRETVESVWLEPRHAVERCRRDEILLPPPTWTTLRMLSKLSSAADVMRWAAERRVVRIEPAFVENDGQTILTLPGDPTFPALDGYETPEETRFILEGGRWRASR